MPGYIKKALFSFGHKAPTKPQHQPHQHTVSTYGATIQYAKAADTSKVISKEDKKYIQQVIGTLLYYGCTVNATILVALSSLASAQATPTEDTMQRTHHLLDYVATHPDAILSYTKSDMVLGIHSDASYLSEPKAQSRAGGHSSSPTAPTKHPATAPFSISPKSSNPSCLQRQKPNLVRSTSTRVKQSPAAPSSKKWATRSPQPQSKPKTAPPSVLSPTIFCLAEPKPWTCIFGGCVTAMHRNNSDIIGAPARPTLATTGQSTIAAPTTKKNEVRFSPHFSSYKPCAPPPTGAQPPPEKVSCCQHKSQQQQPNH